MPNEYTENTFLNTYYDDFKDSDGYARILFNTGRALQAREVTQLQTIIQRQVERFGRNIFKEGAAVNPGGMTVNNKYEFIKLAPATALPTDTSVLIGTEFTGQTSGVKVRVIEVVEATGSDPDTLYVRYTDTSAGTSGSIPIRMSPGEEIDNGTYQFNVQSTNTTNNPAIGRGTRVSIAQGDFFSQGFFVFAPAQSKIISKYTDDPTTDVGFLVTQDIVTIQDDNALYDNSNDLIPNLSAPGADRFRIRLTATTRDEVASDETFVYVGRVIEGILADEVQGSDDYNIINDLLALRTREESGNYNVKPFRIKFEENDSDNTKLNLNISDGISYVNGYRAAVNYPTSQIVSKAQDTVAVNNEVVAANYGNYVVGTGGIGIPNINTFEQMNLRDDSSYGGSTIGTGRVRALFEDGGELRYYLFDVQMNSGESFRSVRSIGTSGTNMFNIALENGQAVLRETGDNNLLFPLPNNRPQSLSDISLTVQRRFTTTTDGSGQATLNLVASGETFANTTDWTIANADSDIATGFSISGAGTATATISGGPISSSNLEVVAYVNKSAGASRSKTLTETTVTGAIESDGAGTRFLDLGVADIFDVSRIRLADSDGANVASQYTLDNGQRDNFYDIGRLILNGGNSVPSGNVFARFRYFQHGTSGDFFSVNSYTGQIDYADIPAHRTNAGQIVQLRNVLDFRAVKDGTSDDFAGTNARVNEIPQTTDLITTDVVYYQPRFAKLVITTDGELRYVEGPSSLTPVIPPTPANSLELYTIRLNPFTLNDSDVDITKIETRRYTMADIGRLEDRLSDLEEVTALSLLELDTSSFEVLDSTGTNRTKSGFFVDNFRNHTFADTTSVEYAASVDPDAGLMRPGFRAESARLIYDSDKSTNTILKGDNVYIKYSETTQIDQPLATGTENINPFSVIMNLGDMELSPSTDNWFEVNRIPARIIDGDANTIDRNLGRNWNNWQWNWGGAPIGGGNRAQENTLDESVVGSSSRTAATTIRRAGRRTTRTTTTTIREVVADRVVDVALVPWMRSIKVAFRAVGMRPNTRVFAFFDGVPVADWVRAEAFTRFANDSTEWGNTQNNATQHPDTPSTLTTDNEGVVTGSFFIPNTENLRFRAGSREFKLLDISVDNMDNATSIARSIFTAQGVIETRQADIVSTRIITTTVTQDPPRDDGPADLSGPRDPLAQSFLVENRNGMFITSVDVFFATKDDEIPVQLQIRPMVNGAPSSTNMVPGSQVYLSPAAVTTSADASLPTTFTFEEPLFLSPLTEYAIVLLAETVEYNVYVAEIAEFLLGSTEQRVTKQPTMGSLFLSQNGSTWSPDQTRDLTFVLRRAEFSQTPATAILENTDLPKFLLPTDPISTDSGSSTVTVQHVNHGFSVADEVTLTVDSGDTIGGISGTSLQGARSITAVDWTGYQFSADSSATASTTGGGSNILADQQILFDVCVPNIETLVPNDTSISFQGQFTTGVSFAGTETAYQKPAGYEEIDLFENNVFNSPRLIATPDNEVAEIGAGERSMTVKADLTTNSTRVSPVIDMQRSAMFLINNVIDNQDSAATSGFNVPLNFVDETDPSAGSSAAKHVTIPISLEEQAVGIKVLIGANRPSVANFKLYYRIAGDGDVLRDQNWTLVTPEAAIPSDENPRIYRDYQYLIGGQGGQLPPFTEFQLKIVLGSTSSSRVPVIKDLRVIALSV